MYILDAGGGAKAPLRSIIPISDFRFPISALPHHHFDAKALSPRISDFGLPISAFSLPLSAFRFQNAERTPSGR